MRSAYFVKRNLWILLVSLSALAFALAPAKEIFVLNHEQKQCAWFWPGDEYVYYAPPEPWQAATPNSDGLIQTQFGSCSFEAVDNNEISAEACCQQLGYTFIGNIKGVVAKRDYGLMFSPIIYCFGIPCGIPIAVLLLYYFSVKRSLNEQNTTGEQDVS